MIIVFYSEALVEVGSCFLDHSAIDEMMEERDGGGVVAAGPQLEGNVSVEEDGIERSLLKNLSSPLFIVYHALQPPTKNQLQELSDTWSELEGRFEDDGIPPPCRILSRRPVNVDRAGFGRCNKDPG
jgi:hypothetical protein